MQISGATGLRSLTSEMEVICNMSLATSDVKFALHPKAEHLINTALHPLIKSGCHIADLDLHVSFNSQLSTQDSVITPYGYLGIKVSEYIPKGYAYIINKGGTQGAFEWVMKGKS